MNRKIAFVLSGSVLLLLSAFATHAAEVYEWRDADGVEHMSDTPPPADQPGVVMLRIDGNDVNSVDLNAGGALDAAAAAAQATPEPAAAHPRTEADCAEIHGRPCSWDNEWRHYASTACNRHGGGDCDNDRHLRREFDPRRRPGETAEQHAVRHAARHGAHRGGAR